MLDPMEQKMMLDLMRGTNRWLFSISVALWTLILALVVK